MAKKKDIYLKIQFEIEGQVYQANLNANLLREYVEQEENRNLEEITIPVSIGQESRNLKFEMKQIRKLLKNADLAISNIIPKYYGYYLEDATLKLVNKNPYPIKGRERELEKVWFYLSQKKKNNVFLIGDIDVGKTTIAKEVCRQISTNECPKEFYDKRVIQLFPERILKIEKDFVFKRVMDGIVKFLEKNHKSIVLYIDNMLYMKTDYSLISLLYSVIKRYNIPLIGTLSIEDYSNYFLPDDAIAKYLNEVYIEEPELYEVEAMIMHHIKKLQKSYGIKISREMIKFGIYTSLLSQSVSVNPGNAINIFNKAFVEAKRKDKKEIDKHCILSCYNTYEKLYNNASIEEKRMIAYHETGHYIVSTRCDNVVDEKIALVSILPMMEFLGVNWPYRILGKTLNYDREYFIDRIAISLGGRIAEKIFTGKDSTGASSDLAHASELAECMICMYGFSKNDSSKNRSYVSDDSWTIKEYLISDSKREELNIEIQEIIDEAYIRAEEIINKNKDLLERIAEELLEKEILTGEELEKICENHKKADKES